MKARTQTWRDLIASPGVWLAAAVIAVAPSICQKVAPPLTSDISTLVLGTAPAHETAVFAEDAVVLEPIHVRKRRNERHMRFRFELSEGGTFSLYGRSSNRDAEPLWISIDSVSVSATAFHSRTGSMGDPLVRERIATGVAIRAGEHDLAVLGPRADRRTLVLELVREAPPSPLRYVGIALGIVIALLVRRWVAARIALPPRPRLAIAVASYAVVLIGLVAWLGVATSGQLAALGEKDPDKVRALRAWEQALDSAAYRDAQQSRFVVAVFGDSTHFWALAERNTMLPTLGRVLPEERREAFHLVGIRGGALNAFDFYLLLNRLIDDPPDLVVIPVSLRSFAEAWLRDPGHRVRDLDAYLAPSELLRSRSLEVAGRTVPLVGWLLRSVDSAFLGGAVEHLLRGVKVTFERERNRLSYIVARVWSGWEPVSLELLYSPRPRYERWNTDIAADHELFDAYRRINDLAGRHGIDVLYYTVQPNARAQLDLGRDLRVRENFAVVEQVIGHGPGVHFLDIQERVPELWFHDDIDHLKAEGMEIVAQAIADAIVSIESGRGDERP